MVRGSIVPVGQGFVGQCGPVPAVPCPRRGARGSPPNLDSSQHGDWPGSDPRTAL